MPDTTRFQVELKGIKLPADALESIQAQVRQVVLAELARLDLRGDYKVTPRFDPEWLGIWVDLSRAKLAAGKAKTQPR